MLRRKSCTSIDTKFGTTVHFPEFRIQRLLEHFRTVPLGTYPHHLPSQEILTLIHLLVIHQEVSNPWLQDIELGRSHILVHTHKTTREETRHQAISSAASPWEGFCTPSTATNPGDCSNLPKCTHFSASTHPKGFVLRKPRCWGHTGPAASCWDSGGGHSQLWSVPGLLQVSHTGENIYFYLLPYCLLSPNNYSPGTKS